ncbi:MAG: hypothetical protein AAGF45_01565 [Pseudomonadota bacterium]
MRRNRFEKVDDVQDDAITLELAPEGDAEMARVHVPATVRPAGEEGDGMDVSEALGKKDAFRGAIRLANTLKAPVVVMGPDAAWDEAWGDLYTPV